MTGAFRTLLRNPGAYLPPTGILALGIGMSVAMFSLVDAVLLRPLPFPGQERIEVIWKSDPRAGTQVEELAYPELGDLQSNIRGFEFVALMPTSLYGYAKVLQPATGDPVQIESAPVSHDFFRVLGVAPALGRDFNDTDERVGAAPVVVLSDQVWRDHFSADAAVIGRLIHLNQQGYTVIGVMAPAVEFPRGAGLWVPLGTDARIVERRGATFLQAIARAKPGIAHDQIARDVNAVFHRVAAEHPEAYTGTQQAVVTPLVEYWTGSARLHLWIMLSASLLLLLAAMVSAGNLILSRTFSRRQELTVRMALGARRSEIVGQLAAEGIWISVFSGAAGLALAQAVIRILVRWAPADIPRLASAALDLKSFALAALLAALAVIACTAIPGRLATQLHLESALREGGARLSLSRTSGRVKNLFVTAQTALTMTLLLLATLLVLSYRFMISAETGFTHRDTLSMNLHLRGTYDAPARRAFYILLLNKLREAPGVTSAAAILLRPLEGTIGWDVPYQFGFEAVRKDRKVLPKSNYEVVTPDYFKTVGTPLLEGRDFNEHDEANGEPVAIVSQSLARQIRTAGFAPLGHRLLLGLGQASGYKIVGVAGEARYRSIAEPGTDIFVPSSQAGPPTNYVVIRGSVSSRELATLVRRTLGEIDPHQAIAGVATLGELAGRNAARHRFNMILLLWFGVCAAVLAATGVYSVISEAMLARSHEFAIRTFLGAPPRTLVREMVSATLAFVLLGEMVGAGLFCMAGSAAAGLFYGVSARDPVVLGTVAVLLFALSFGAALWPACLGAKWRIAGI